MTKKEIARELMKRTDFSASQATIAVDGIIDIIAEALIKNEDVKLYKFGSIKTVQRAAKPVRNIRMGTTIMLPPRKQVKFIECKELQQRINNNYENSNL